MRTGQDNSPYHRHTFFFTKKKIVGKKEKNILACRYNYKLFVYLPLGSFLLSLSNTSNLAKA
jgi:hypothetical protein